IDIQRATEIENLIHHDLMAEIKTYGEQCPLGGSVIHMGATSMDILDNTDVLRQKEALKLIITLLEKLLATFVLKIRESADTPCIGFTHIQPAEPTTIGYRLAFVAQDLLHDLKDLKKLEEELKGKGIKGAVGTAASYNALLEKSSMSAFQLEKEVMDELSLKSFLVASQVYPRKQDWRVANALAGVAASLSKLALDLRLMQSPPIGEYSEPFGKSQVGSSAMPFKRNPILGEKVCSLARLIASQVAVLWDNAANSALERTLDDSANRRIVIPLMFLATEEIILSSQKLIESGTFNSEKIKENLKKYGMFAATEPLLMALGSKGANRQDMHELIRSYSLKAWIPVQAGLANPLAEDLANEPLITEYLSKEEVLCLMDEKNHTGDAKKRSLLLADEIEAYLN
ncbi:MAG: adenylosuccinate lyase, partial [Candidatus Cloacimonetes bacterium]|nr:adenylosuccinate lyase [Candidatus Cloacimonadota bacterium]